MPASHRSSIRLRLKYLLAGFRHFKRHFSNAIRLGHNIIDAATVIAAILTLVCLVIIGGYDHSPHDLAMLRHLLRVFQGVFLLNVLYNLILRTRATLCANRAVKWIVDSAMLVTLLPLLYPHPDNPWIPWLEKLLYSHYFIYAVLCAYSIVEVSYFILSLIGKRTNPSLLLSGSFLFFILVGSFVLMLPKFTAVPINYVDALFVATSAVCITGLTPVDIATTFTPAGHVVLCILFQVGALGVLTFTCFFAIFFSGRTSVYNQLLVRDMIYSKTMNSLFPTLLYIMAFTMTIEVVGAVAYYFTVPETLFADTSQRLLCAVFQSLSSFCNVGFTVLPQGLSTPALMTPGQSVFIVTSVLVAAGGIGFPILVNFKDSILQHLRKLFNRLRGRRYTIPVHLMDLNTRLVLTTYLWILGVASVAFFVLEYDNSLAGMSLWEKMVQSVFNSLVPRSAGFASVNPAGFLPLTMMLIVVQMWIGGASQSLAGGIKVNTLAAVVLNARSIITGTERAHAYGRAISIPTIRRANVVVFLSLAMFFLFSATLMILEPRADVWPLLFEVTSALFTVGSSLGITDSLGDLSKITLCLAMFVGRVGIISLLTGLVRDHRDISRHLPEENLIIN